MQSQFQLRHWQSQWHPTLKLSCDNALAVRRELNSHVVETKGSSVQWPRDAGTLRGVHFDHAGKLRHRFDNENPGTTFTYEDVDKLVKQLLAEPST